MLLYIVANGGHIEGTTGGHYWRFQWHQNKGRGNFVIQLVSMQSTYFVRQLSVENVRVFIFVSVTPLYSSGGPFNMAAVGFSFPKIHAQSSPIFEISDVNQLNEDLRNAPWHS